MCFTSAGKTPTNFFAQLKRLKLLGTKVEFKILTPQNTNQKFCESAVNKKTLLKSIYNIAMPAASNLHLYSVIYIHRNNNAMYNSRKYSYPPPPTPPMMEGTFASEPLPCWDFHSRKCLSYLPTPCNFHDSSILMGYPPEYFCQKSCFTILLCTMQLFLR